MRPSWNDFYLQIAQSASRRGECTRSQVGAILVKVLPDKRHQTSIGYNGTDPGAPNCLTGACPRGRFTYDELPPIRRTIGPVTITAWHSMPRITQSPTRPSTYTGAVLFVTREPCADCHILMARQGIAASIWPTGWTEYAEGPTNLPPRWLYRESLRLIVSDFAISISRLTLNPGKGIRTTVPGFSCHCFSCPVSTPSAMIPTVGVVRTSRQMLTMWSPAGKAELTSCQIYAERVVSATRGSPPLKELRHVPGATLRVRSKPVRYNGRSYVAVDDLLLALQTFRADLLMNGMKTEARSVEVVGAVLQKLKTHDHVNLG